MNAPQRAPTGLSLGFYCSVTTIACPIRVLLITAQNVRTVMQHGWEVQEVLGAESDFSPIERPEEREIA